MEGDSLQSAETNREERPSRMVLTVTEDTPADMLAGSMELLVQLPRDHHLHTQRVTVQRSTPMMDLLVQIATAHKLAASSYTLQAIGERGLVLPHQPNTPIGALDALQVKLLPKQGTFLPRKTRQANQPFETTFRLQVHLPRNQLYVSRVSPKMNLGEILSEVCREKNLDRNKYELRHPANLEESLDLSLSLQDYHLQEVTLYAKQQGRTLGSALSSQDIMALQRQEERRRQQAKQSVFGFMFKKSKESSLSTDSLGGRSVSPARSDETGRSASPLQPPARPQRKRRPAPKPPVQTPVAEETTGDSSKDKMVISHSRNSSDSSGYHEASVLSDNPDLAARLPETLPRRNRAPGDVPRKLAHTSQSSKSLGNLAIASGGLSHGISSTSLSSAGLRKKRAAPPPPVPRPLSSAISTQALERIVDSEESLTSDMDPSKPPSDIGAPSKASSDIEDHPKASSDIGVTTVKPVSVQESAFKSKSEAISNEKGTDSLQEEPKAQSRVDEIRPRSGTTNVKAASGDSEVTAPIADAPNVETARVPVKRDIEDGWTETDILLQKVSDTLSNSLPKSSSPLPTMSSKDICSTEAQHAGTSNIFDPTKINTEARLVGSIDDTVKDKLKSSNQKDSNVHEATNLKASAPNTTIGSQQDTSDYVSAVGEDLSISEWEYQLPAPPSAFRDRNSPAFDGYDTITLGSVEAFKEPVMEIVDQVDATECCNKNIIQPVDEYSKDSKLKSSDKQKLPCEEITIKEKTPVEVKSIIKHTVTNHVNLELKKEIISELESKIETGCLPQCTTKEFDTKRVGDRTSAPQIAPIDNTLSNFKITTYARQKSLNIYDDPEESHNTFGKSLDHRTVKSSGSTFTNKNKLENLEGKISTECFKRNSGDSYNDKNIINRCKSSNTNQNSMTFTNLEPKTYNEDESIQRQDSFNSNNEKTNVYRSKSYISMSNNEKYKGATQDYSEDFQRDVHVTNMRRSTSITNINVDAPRNNEKFSQWRDNILKRQEEPTKEKQLQSIQILKSILPQLKNAQQAEESVSKEHTTLVQEEPKLKIPPEENSIESNVELQQESETMSKSGHNKTESKKVNAKRYTYSGPPAINLGSWSERPSINVQIKMDTDYKLGTNKATSKTIVSIKNSMDEKDIVKATGNVSNIPDKHPTVNNFVKYNIRSDTVVNKKEPNDLARKLITHTTASGFKKPSVNKVHGTDSRTIVENEGRPIVTGVELKKAFVEKQEQPANRENDIDTSSVSFRELTKAFGQDISHKPKYKYFNTNRHSDYYDTSIQKTDIKNTENRFANCNKAGNQVDSTFKNSTAVNGIQNNLQPKKFTSVVGIHSQTYQCPMQNGTFPVRNNNTNKLNVVEPFVKGFRVHALSTDVNKANNHVSQNGSSGELKKTGSEMPKPPTMPVITGVTLKSASARPKSMPVQTDPRDSLLESIRNFGGREKLKSAASRY